MASRVLLGSWIMALLLAIHALSILALVESLVMSLIGKMVSSLSISFAQNVRIVPSSFRVFVPRMRSNPGWLIYVHHTSQCQVVLSPLVTELQTNLKLSAHFMHL